MNYVKRSEWGASAPRSSSRITGVKGIALHWNGPKMNIGDHKECAGKVRGTQSFHMNTRKWADIAYNWLVCPHGTVYEGRGWNVRSAAQGTNYGNAYYHAAMYLGGPGELTEAGKRGLRAVVDESRKRYGNKVRAHSFFRSTDCPGVEIRSWISKGLPVQEGDDDSAPKEPSAPQPSSNVLQRGSKGAAVKEWQQKLKKWNASALPQFGVDGDFGDETVDWTGRFMVAAKLVSSKPDNPQVGSRTQAAMDKVLAEASKPAPAPSGDILRPGDKGTAVRTWQNQLRKWNSNALPKFGADGDFGDETKDWTERFQRAAKIGVDGIVGPQTRAAMEKALSKPSFSFRYKVELSDGHKGPSVTEWQEALRRWNSKALPRFGADGHFGDETADWTGRFMVAAKLVSSKPSNPIVGSRTRSTMEKVLNAR